MAGLAVLTLAAAGCGEDEPAEATPLPSNVEITDLDETPLVQPWSCDQVCDRLASCDMGELGDRFACMSRCRARVARDLVMLDCLATPTPDGARRCDLARRCVSIGVDRASRPPAVTAERDRFDASSLGPEIELALEARLLNAGPDGSRYDLVLVMRGRGQWDGGLGDLDAGEPLDAGVFDGGLQGPDVWLRIGPYSSDGRLPLLRIEPLPAEEVHGATLFEHASHGSSTGDTYRIRYLRDELVVEHAFAQASSAGGAEVRSDFETDLRIRLTRDARVTARRQVAD